MSKRNRNQAAKRDREHAPTVVAVTTTTIAAVSPQEQLRFAFDELKASTANLVETALHEVRLSATAILQELRSRATTLLTSMKQPARVGRRGNGVTAEHSNNPALS